MKYVVLFLILIGFFGTAFALESEDYFSDPNFQIYKIKEKQYEFFLPYSTNAKIQNITLDCASSSMIIYLDSTKNNGTLSLNISRNLLDHRTFTQDEYLFVLVDSQEVEYSEVVNSASRTLMIPFIVNSKEIEIIALAIIGPGGSTIGEKSYCGIGSTDKSQYYSLLSPLKQLKSGMPLDEIQCNENFILIQKDSDSPACVKPVTKQHLIDRNWAETKSLDEIKHNPNLIKQNIIRIEEGFISLYPENTCASISLDLPTGEDIQRYTNDEKGLDKTNVLRLIPEDLKEIPDVEELIYAVHFIEFPYNDFVQIHFEGVDFVKYEFFLMDKMIDKYGGTQKDYFMKLDADYEERLTNPKQQGLSNEFLAPQIMYHGNAYVISGTVFWTSEENNLSMSIQKKDSIDENQKSIILTDEDMKSVPKIKEAIENIGTVKRSISAHKGLPEVQWNEYREWFKQKSQDRLDADRFRLIQYDEHLYSIGFGIC